MSNSRHCTRGSFELSQKIGPDRFSRLDALLGANKQTEKLHTEPCDLVSSFLCTHKYKKEQIYPVAY